MPGFPLFPARHRTSVWVYGTLAVVSFMALMPALVRSRLGTSTPLQADKEQAVVPDVAIRHLTGLDFDSIDTRNTAWVGEGRAKDEKTPPPVLSVVTFPDASELYEVRVKNVGAGTGTSTLALSNAATGWTVGFVEANGKTALKPSTTWTTPILAPGQEATVQLQMTNKGAITPLSVSVTGRGSGGGDGVRIDQKVQHIARIEWSLGNEKWSPVTSTSVVQVSRDTVIGMRAIKAFPDFEWGGHNVLGPKWSFQGNRVEGGEVWLGAEDSTAVGTPVVVTLGNTQSLRVKVLPEAEVSLDADSGRALVLPGATETTPVNITISVTDDDEKPLPKTRVRLRSARGDNPVFSQWQVPGDKVVEQGKEVVLVTDEQGEIHVLWWVKVTAARPGEQVTITAEAIDNANEPFGEDDDLSFTVAAAEGN